jgi:hypothetical protein
LKKYICLLALPLILLAGVAYGGVQRVTDVTDTIADTLVTVTCSPATAMRVKITDEAAGFLNKPRKYDQFLAVVFLDTLTPVSACAGINNCDTAIITWYAKPDNGWYLYPFHVDTVTSRADTITYVYFEDVQADGSGTTVLDSTDGIMNVGGYYSPGTFERTVLCYDSLYIGIVRRDTAVNTNDTATFNIKAWFRFIENDDCKD